MVTSPPTHCSAPRPLRLVSAVPLTVKDPEMHVVPAPAKAFRLAWSLIVTLPCVTVSLQAMAWMTVPHTPEKQFGGPWVAGQTSWLLQLVPQEFARLRLTSQPLVIVPSQFLVPAGQGVQPCAFLQTWASAVQSVAGPQ